eukprot:TRINITY_DN3227_c1_g1_i1.p1 TRINITY_DN3227_c1_g1~~TRINITY_DN3227_c1_g1_i1.p1  ORF type:complete len:262 (+),score=48.29 TRINITY_DN3227_c1_g1_i1:91-876(+)
MSGAEGRPRFRGEVVWQRRTYLGSTSTMKRSQWSMPPSPLPEDSMSPQAMQQAVEATRPVGHEARLPKLTEPWRPGAWNAGRRYVGYESTFGTPPTAQISDTSLQRRIDSLQRGTRRAHSESSQLSRAILEGCTARRGALHEAEIELDRELEIALAERARRDAARQARRDQRRVRRQEHMAALPPLAAAAAAAAREATISATAAASAATAAELLTAPRRPGASVSLPALGATTTRQQPPPAFCRRGGPASSSFQPAAVSVN